MTRLIFNDGKSIRHGEPLHMDIYFKTLQEVEEASFGVGFCNRDGVRLVSIDTDISGERVRIPANRTGVVSVKIPIFHMEPDLYTIDIGIRSGDNFPLDSAAGCGSVLVVPGDSTPSVIAMRESGRGGLRQPAIWTIQYNH